MLSGGDVQCCSSAPCIPATKPAYRSTVIGGYALATVCSRGLLLLQVQFLSSSCIVLNI
jgi:hypothetical protein